MADKYEKHRKLLNGKNASYAVAAGAVSDILLSVFQPEYVGLFSSIARLLTGG
jgi:hypothetical protein